MHGDVEHLAQALLDLEAVRRGDVLEVDAAEGRGDARHGLDEILRVVAVHLDVEHIDIGKLLEQHRLAFHHRLGRQRAGVAQAQHRSAIADDRHQIALGGVLEGVVRVGLDGLHRLGHAG